VVVDELRDRMLRGNLVHDVRRLLRSGAADHGRWIRENLRDAIRARRQDAVSVSALSGLATGTVRGFLNGRPSSIDNVLLIAQAVGYTLADLDRPPDEFRRRLNGLADGIDGGAIGASLLAFDESPTPMMILLIDGTIIKVNREFRQLLGYGDGELVGASAETVSLSSDQARAERVEEMAESGVLRGQTVQLRRKDGSHVAVVTSAVVVRDHEDLPRYVIARAAPADG
jgi:PAS domain S-box-containing protein